MNFLFALLMKFQYLFLRVIQNREYPAPLSDAEEEECLKKVLNGDLQARNRLIEHNLRLVAHIVKKYYSQSKNQDDLMSIGTIGLIKAVDTYKNGSGTNRKTEIERIFNTFKINVKSVFYGIGNSIRIISLSAQHYKTAV